MKIATFELERTQSLWENTVRYNLTETGIHPYSLHELLDKSEIAKLCDIRMGYGQTNGSIELREAISGLYPGAGLENVLVTNGSAEANFIAMWHLIEPGDEMVLMLPNYMQIWGVARAFGAKVKPFHLREELQWHFDLDELRCVVSPGTKIIAVCNPNNPTGAVLTEQEMQEVVRLAEECGAWIYADEVYRGAELRGEETATFSGRYDKAIVCCGLSKAYALPGLRIGWLVGAKDFIDKAWAYHDYTSIAPGILSDRVAASVLQLNNRMQVLNRNRKILRENLGVLTEWVENHANLFRFVPPQAGGLAFLRYSMVMNSTEFSTKLREEKSVFVVAGDCFGMDGYVRIGIGSERLCFVEGLRLVDEYLRSIVTQSTPQPFW